VNIKNTLLNLTKTRSHLLPKWSIWIGLVILTTMAIILTKDLNIFESLEAQISQTENRYQKWGDSQPLTNPWLLIPFAAGGGLLASISPCILAMLPVNLSYIGTLNVKSRREACWNATGFVLGVVTILSIFGLFSSVAGAVMVEWRGVDKYEADRGTLLVFLLTITRSRALNRIKQQSSQHNLSQRVGNYLPRIDRNPGMESVTLGELRERMNLALRELPTTQKQVLEMGYYY
jgi:hypothetical protein